MNHEINSSTDPCDDFSTEDPHFKTAQSDDKGDDQTDEKLYDTGDQCDPRISHTLQSGKIHIQQIQDRQEGRHDTQEAISNMICLQPGRFFVQGDFYSHGNDGM